jgi:hypothetical protein
MESDLRRERLAFACLVFAVAAPSLYVCHRLFEVLQGGGEDPALILSQAHVGFYWRIGSAIWLSLAASVAAFALAPTGDTARRGAEWIGRMVPWLVPLLAFLAWRFP